MTRYGTGSRDITEFGSLFITSDQKVFRPKPGTVSMPTETMIVRTVIRGKLKVVLAPNYRMVYQAELANNGEELNATLTLDRRDSQLMVFRWADTEADESHILRFDNDFNSVRRLDYEDVRIDPPGALAPEVIPVPDSNP